MAEKYNSPGRAGPRILMLIFAALVAISILLVARSALDHYIENPTRDLTHDIDWGYLNRGLDRIDTFSDTARWWTGAWCGEVPFWRPLTSYVFWGMRLLWPKEYMLPRQIILVAVHLCFVAVSGLLLWRLTRRPWLTLTALWLFAGLRPWPVGNFFGGIASVGGVLSDPKNITDPLAGIAIAASLLFLAEKRWVAGLIAATVSVCFKETGFTTWPAALLVLAWMNRDRIMASGRAKYIADSIRRNRLPIAIWLLTLVALAAIHYFAVGIGYQFGTNRAWPWRAAGYFGGPLGVKFVMRDPSPAILAILIVVAMLRLKHSSLIVRFAGLLAALTAGILLDTRILGTTWDVSMVRLLTYDLDLKTVLICVFWLLVAWEARRDWQTAAFGLAVSFVAAAPTWMAAQAQEHSRYVASFFMEVAVAAALCQSAKAIAQTVIRKRVTHDIAAPG